MIRRTICSTCGVKCEYDDKSVWEGNREIEILHCPACNSVIGKVFTDLNPIVRILEKDDSV